MATHAQLLAARPALRGGLGPLLVVFVAGALAGSGLACREGPLPVSGRAASTTSAEAGTPCGAIPEVGCCSGGTLLYCSASVLKSEPCAPALACGWSSVYGLYVCGTSSAAAPSDSGSPARVCPGAMDGAVEKGQADGGSSCPAGLTYAGCCQGTTLYFCASGKVLSLSCQSSPACGWDSKKSYYRCGTSGGADPSGVNPILCSPGIGDAWSPTEGGAVDGASDVRGDETGWVGEGQRTDAPEERSASSHEHRIKDGASPTDVAAREVVGLDATGLEVGGGERTEIRASGGGGCTCALDGKPAGATRAGWVLGLAILVVGLATSRGVSRRRSSVRARDGRPAGGPT
jgi:hypothetical protein